MNRVHRVEKFVRNSGLRAEDFEKEPDRLVEAWQLIWTGLGILIVAAVGLACALLKLAEWGVL